MIKMGLRQSLIYRLVCVTVRAFVSHFTVLFSAMCYFLVYVFPIYKRKIL